VGRAAAQAARAVTDGWLLGAVALVVYGALASPEIVDGTTPSLRPSARSADGRIHRAIRSTCC